MFSWLFSDGTWLDSSERTRIVHCFKKQNLEKENKLKNFFSKFDQFCPLPTHPHLWTVNQVSVLVPKINRPNKANYRLEARIDSSDEFPKGIDTTFIYIYLRPNIWAIYSTDVLK